MSRVVVYPAGEPGCGKELTVRAEMTAALAEVGIGFEKWECGVPLALETSLP